MFWGIVGLSAAANEPLTVNPIEGVKTASVEISIGGGMRREASPALELFDGHAKAAEEFEADLRQAISARFAKVGIALTQDASHVLMVNIWGRPLDVGERGYVALVDVSFHDLSKIEDPNYCADSSVTYQREILEVTEHDKLSASLRNGAMVLVGEVVARGTATNH